MISHSIPVKPSVAFCAVVFCSAILCAQSPATPFKVVAFYSTPANESAHVSFVHDANRWFPQMGTKYNFSYEATTNWDQMNATFLSQYQVVLFLDSRPDNLEQRKAFEDYMDHGGAWMGFHFAGFALTPSEFPQNWDWYHQQFLGSGEYWGNSWPPVPAVLRVEDLHHPATKDLPVTFKSAPSEWYRWNNNLRANPDIKVLLSIDPVSFPLGKSAKTNETWHSGDYPVVWTNQKYKMIYMNMGHDDLDYKANPHKQLSSTFDSEMQNKLILNSLLWLGGGKGFLITQARHGIMVIHFAQLKCRLRKAGDIRVLRPLKINRGAARDRPNLPPHAGEYNWKFEAGRGSLQ